MTEPPPLTAPMIELDNVTKTYGQRTIVADLSLCVRRGQLLALLGGSGCGKTTTLKMINRLIEPTRGTIRVDGRDVGHGNPVELRRRIGYVFQGVGLFPHLTIAENVAVVPRLLKWSPERIAPRVTELLDMIHLPLGEYGGRYPAQLSGGQQQRVGFARALAAEPKVILMDEPFGALDPITRSELRADFLSVRHRLGLTAVMVTHDMMEALLSADLIAVMRDGRIVQIGTPKELLNKPADEFVERLMAVPREELRRLRELEGAR